MRLLLVEDSERLQRAVGLGLKKAGYALDITGDGNEGLWYAKENRYDAIILDLMLRGLDGLSLLRRLRDSGNDTHILILTARDSIHDRVRGLEAGGDDYLVKPFAFDELLARIEALCRRAYGAKRPSLTIAVSRIDTARREASRAAAPISLTPREYSILEYLARRRGEVVTRTEIEEHIYDSATETSSNAIDSAICVLRRKITPPGACALIHTRRGQGYILDSINDPRPSRP